MDLIFYIYDFESFCLQHSTIKIFHFKITDSHGGFVQKGATGRAAVGESSIQSTWVWAALGNIKGHTKNIQDLEKTRISAKVLETVWLHICWTSETNKYEQVAQVLHANVNLDDLKQTSNCLILEIAKGWTWKSQILVGIISFVM